MSSPPKTHVTETPDVSHIKNVDVSHETTDVSVGGIVKFVIALTVLTIVIFVGLWGIFRMLDRKEEQKDVQRSPLALSESERLPPEPRLQGAPGFASQLKETQTPNQETSATAGEVLSKPKSPLSEIDALRAQWRDALDNGPRDENGNRYGMPIEEAKKKLLEQGLPVRGQNAPGSK
jgi:hypothetical protein